MKRLANIYSKAALVAFNSALLALVVLWGVEAVLDFRHTLTGRGNVVHSDDIDLSSFRLVPAETARKIADDYDKWGSDQPFEFNPWTTFMLAPFSSDYINVRRNEVLSYRRNRPEPTENGMAANSPFTVWAFGGSTLFGFGVSDALTIPAFLEKYLARRIIDRPVRVINFGQPYWFSSVESAAYVALLRSRRPPEAVIFLDGLNDISWGISGYTVPVFAARASRAWERQRLDAKRELPWISFNESFPLKRLVTGLNYYVTGNPVAVKADPYRIANGQNEHEVYSTMRKNYEMVRTLSNALGVEAFVFLQPVAWFGKYKSPVDSAFPFGSSDNARKTYRLLIEASQGALSGILYDLSDELHRFDKPFLDRAHYSDAANKQLAKKIAAVISPRFLRP